MKRLSDKLGRFFIKLTHYVKKLIPSKSVMFVDG